MFRNYVITAFRNLWGYKTFSFINVTGLSIGLSASLVIFMIVYYELSFDRSVKDANRVYRVTLDATINGSPGHSSGVPAPLGAAMQTEVSGLEKVIPVFQFQGDASAKVSIQGKAGNPVFYKKQKDIVFTSQAYMELLDFRWMAGSPSSALADPFSVVLTESRARLYFPGIPASELIGKQITYNDITAVVSGVVRDLSQQTSFNASEFISLATIAKTSLQNNFMMDVWDDWMAYSQLYVKLSPEATNVEVETKLKKLLNKYNKNANRDAANNMSLHLQPLNDIHFNTLYQGVNQRTASKPCMDYLPSPFFYYYLDASTSLI